MKEFTIKIPINYPIVRNKWSSHVVSTKIARPVDPRRLAIAER
jgi:hypothetical protein